MTPMPFQISASGDALSDLRSRLAHTIFTTASDRQMEGLFRFSCVVAGGSRVPQGPAVRRDHRCRRS